MALAESIVQGYGASVPGRPSMQIKGVSMSVEVIIALGSLASSVIIPFVSVWAAQRLVRADQRRHAAMELFNDILRHSLQYKDAVLKHTSLVTASEEVRRESHQSIRNADIDLMTDEFRAGLLFGNNALKALGLSLRALRTHAANGVEFDPDSFEKSFSELQSRLDQHILRIMHEIRPLWELLQSRRSRDTIALKLPDQLPKE